MTTIFTASGDVLYEAPVTKSAIIKQVLMGDYYIELSFNAAEYIDFHKGCYIEYKGRKFEILRNIYPEKGTNGGVKYTIRFESQQTHLKKCKVFWLASENKETTFHNTTNLASFGNLIVDNVNRYLGYDSWELGGVPADLEEKTKLVSFNGDWCWDALNTIAETFDVEWWTIEHGDTVSLFFGKMAFGTEEDFVKGDVVTSIPPKRGDDSDYGTRFYVFGSTRNLSSSYNQTAQGGAVNHVSEPRLRLPNGQEYIDAIAGMSPNDVVEQVVFFEDIFPKNTETITAIETVEREIVEGETNIAYVMVCEDTPFTVDDLIEGETLGCQFTSGSLMGREFELQINKDGFDKRFEILAQTESYGDQVLIIPNENLHPKAEDTFILTGVELPTERIIEAENELLEAGTNWAIKHSQDTDVYDCPTNPVYCREHDKNYDLGQCVRLVGHRFGDGGRVSRIQGYEKKLYDEYQAVYTVGDNTAYSRLGNIEKSVQSVAYSEHYGVSSGSGIRIIRSKYDSTVPTDYNVYSALASELLFLNKRKGGTVLGEVVFNNDVQFNDDAILAGDLRTEDFSQGNLLGSGAALYRDVYGNTVVELDKLIVRQEAYFNELVINQTTFVLGETVFTMAGCEIERVTRYSTFYRCYYDNKDGNRMSGFVVGDQARCQRFDPSHNAVVKYYWRLVVGVGDDYVDLSISDCDGSGAPEKGDEIVHLGNRTDLRRQHAIVIVSTPKPSILQYRGINSYSMPAPVTKIAPDENLFSGKVHITGGSGASNLDDLDGIIDDIVQKAIGDIQFPDVDIDFDSIEFGTHNRLRNSGFNGDYIARMTNQQNGLPYEGDLITPSLKYWTHYNSTAQLSDESQSGVEVVIHYGEIEQTLVEPIVVGAPYVVSFKAKGSYITFYVAGVKKTIGLTSEYTRYVEKFEAVTDEAVFKIGVSDCTICELQLERGTVASAWNYSIWDDTSAVAYYKAVSYLTDAIINGSTTIVGGLILTQLIALGNYTNGEMQKVTAGINGKYEKEDDLAFWAGGDIGQAAKTVQMFKYDPQYSPTEEEWAQMAKFAVTHSGDVFMRGYINALGGYFNGYINALDGYFRGTVDIADQKILLDSDGSGHFANGNVRWDSYGRVTKSAPDSIAWTRVDSYADVNEYNGGVVEIDFSKGSYLILAFNSMNYDPLHYPDTYSLETPAEGYTIAICNGETDGGSLKAYLIGTFYYYENGVKKTASKITFGTSKYVKFLTAELVFNAAKGWEVRTDHKCTITSNVLYIDTLDGEADEDDDDFCTGDYDLLDGDGQRVTLRIENGRIKEVR